ncbi:ecto-ADP-ribosyltransferase 5-like [Hemibagrus wyckioides]|uniref:ecto-ADP-ribosyltransferase 5-like n=1 Tax=Hemibagrus wyckioides TaxID=337641 RepID=UPI00266C786D|nr:ecto-ADP-ribosyltransferase 5-like [Hemibagrus wyckioides]
MRKAVFINTTAIIIINTLAVVCTWEKDMKLDMALDSVDDQYIGCENEMYNLVKSKILKEELGKRKLFKKVWNDYSNSTDDFERIIKVYTAESRNKKGPLYKKLNEAVGSGRKNYRTKFKYKAFHFLLTRALQIYKVPTCAEVFRRTNVSFERKVSNQEMRFDRFASTSEINNMNSFGNISCFKIETCYGANISNFSVYQGEKEVLIPPYEKFKITNITGSPNEMNCRVLYTLKSAGTCSNMNCELLNKKTLQVQMVM